MEVFIFLATLFVLLPLGIPIAIILVLCAIALMAFTGNWDPSIISQQMVMGTNNFPLMAIPFFMLSGELMSAGGLSQKIVDFANIVVGRVRGGFGYAAVLASMLFAGLSGSPVADAVALGSILVPLMVQNGYKVDRAVGLICAGAIIAPIIPPSIPMIVLGTSVGVSVSRLFMSGLVPGVILGLALMGAWYWIVRKDGYNDVRKYSWRESWKIIRDSLPALFMPILIIGGIRFGIFTPTEAGAFAAVYAFIISVFWYRELKPNKIVEIFVNTAKSTAVVMFIVAAATAVGWFITVAQIPMQVASLFEGFIDKPVLLLLIINFFLFVLGMVMDLTPNLLIFGPVLFPVIERAGIDPVFFGLIMTLNLCIGLITPPVGTILYLGCSMGNISLSKVVRGVLPFLVVELIILILFTTFPQIVLVPYHMIIG